MNTKINSLLEKGLLQFLHIEALAALLRNRNAGIVARGGHPRMVKDLRAIVSSKAIARIGLPLCQGELSVPKM